MWVDQVTKIARPPAAVACGPGLGSEGYAAVQTEILSYLKEASDLHGVVLDASACRMVLDSSYPAQLREKTVLTPHGGEWKALGGPPVHCVSDLKRAAAWNADTLGVWTLLKGSVSVLLPPSSGETVRVHSQPNPSLATAGTGDCLTGVLLAVMARRSRPVHETVALALQLMDAAGRKVVHPSASIFPDLIRGALGDHFLPLY